jgi:hypothetical protein
VSAIHVAPLTFEEEGDMRHKTGLIARVLLAAALAGVMLVAFASPAPAVSAFSRQTNMACNQCHVDFTIVPDFTITGKKFRSTGYRQVDVRENVEFGEEGDLGQRIKLPLLDYWCMRLESTPLAISSNPATGKYGEVTTNPTTRLAMFWVGPIGDHMGIWNEWYFHVLGDGEWSLDLASWDEFDLKWVFNPENPDYRICMGLTNQPISDEWGFGPFPIFAGGGYDFRSEVEGLAHPNVGNPYIGGWMYDRWVWTVVGNTGDTNDGWKHANIEGQLAYAIQNTNENELWLRVLGRSGTDMLPLVTSNYVEPNTRSWAYKDAFIGVSETRENPEAGAYLASDIDHSSSLMGEIRWSKQNWNGHLSFETVLRVAHAKDKYRDGASMDIVTVGTQTYFGIDHTYYIDPFWNTKPTMDFTDYTGHKYAMDAPSEYGLDLVFRPTENFDLYFTWIKFPVYKVMGDALNKGNAFSVGLDFYL